MPNTHISEGGDRLSGSVVRAHHVVLRPTVVHADQKRREDKTREEERIEATRRE
jgi:hypothetical protein